MIWPNWRKPSPARKDHKDQKDPPGLLDRKGNRENPDHKEFKDFRESLAILDQKDPPDLRDQLARQASRVQQAQPVPPVRKARKVILDRLEPRAQPALLVLKDPLVRLDPPVRRENLDRKDRSVLWACKALQDPLERPLCPAT